MVPRKNSQKLRVLFLLSQIYVEWLGDEGCGSKLILKIVLVNFAIERALSHAQ